MSTGSVFMNKAEAYRGFTISWQEPPQTSAKGTANVASEDPRLHALMGRHGASVIDGRTRDDMIARAKASIDSMLG
jgi:hypothetical protein